jgi:hypothetical protein
MSAAQRLATIKQKNHDEIMELVRRRSSTPRDRGNPHRDPEEEGPPPWFILRLLGESSWYQTAVQMNSLGQKSTRNILWDAVTHNTSLFQCVSKTKYGRHRACLEAFPAPYCLRHMLTFHTSLLGSPHGWD